MADEAEFQAQDIEEFNKIKTFFMLEMLNKFTNEVRRTDKTSNPARDYSFVELLTGFDRESIELGEAIHQKKENYDVLEDIKGECVDVATFALFIYWKAVRIQQEELENG